MCKWFSTKRILCLSSSIVLLVFLYFPVPTSAQQAFNMYQWASGVLGAMANYGTSPGAVLVPGVNAFITGANSIAVTGTFNSLPQFQNQYALSTYDLNATAATNIKNAIGNVYAWYGYNPNTSTCYLQFYNSTSATLGTSALHPFGIIAGASFNITPGSMPMFNLTVGISTGETTTPTGSTQCSTAMPISIIYD